jgi:putative hydrolase of HD superfamily
MEEKLKNSMRFYMLATQLKYKIRSGWDKSHWNVSKERVESIAEHVYGTCILALSIDSEFKTNLDINKVIKMLVLHELGEVIIGDITPFDNITPEEKMKKEHEAMREVIGDLVNQEEFLSLLFEFDEKKTKEAIFAHHCDKLEADIQAKVYQDMGCQHPLDEQENNVVFKSNKVQQMVKDGAQTAFDIWYEWDKSLYYDDEDFARLLDYVRTINTQELLK